MQATRATSVLVIKEVYHGAAGFNHDPNAIVSRKPVESRFSNLICLT
jgi:hypothetical protein